MVAGRIFRSMQTHVVGASSPISTSFECDRTMNSDVTAFAVQRTPTSTWWYWANLLKIFSTLNRFNSKFHGIRLRWICWYYYGRLYVITIAWYFQIKIHTKRKSEMDVVWYKLWTYLTRREWNFIAMFTNWQQFGIKIWHWFVGISDGNNSSQRALTILKTLLCDRE